jgi:2-C-methyl-D-erythritol 4-phosphate cytidylyltransferase
VEIATVEGEANNIKITEPIDMFLADKLFQSRGDRSILDASWDSVERELSGRVVVVFGGSSGIGRSICEAALRCRARVHGFSRSTTGTDVTSAESVKRALESAFADEGGIDCVVNTAAYFVRRPLIHLDDGEILECINTNFRGAVHVARESYPFLVRTAGSLLLFTSSSYTRGRAYYGVYSATKAAVVNLTQALAEEWEADSIRVNCLNPERTATPMRARNFGPESPETLLDPARVAEASLAVLASSRSGQVVDVRIARSSDVATDQAASLARDEQGRR